MRLIVTPAAQQDMASIFEYVSVESPKSALKLIDRLHETFKVIADSPLSYPFVYGRHRFGVRRAVVAPYLVFYRSVPDLTHILRVLHGARDYDSLLFGDDD